MIRIPRRNSFVSMAIFVGFIWFVILIVFYSNKAPEHKSIEVKLDKIEKNKLIAKNSDESIPEFDDFEDDFADFPNTTKFVKRKRVMVKRPSLKLKPHSRSGNLDPPPVQQEILNLHERLNLSNPGHMGKPVILPSNLPYEIQEKVNKSWEIYSINEFVSNLISLYRELPDIRPDYCRTVKYSDNLPVASVILVFHNEPFSMIMRSVFALFKRTPPELLGEVVLVDDFSDRDQLKGPLEKFIKDYPKIKLVRSATRGGLIKARMIGSVNAEGPALVFMDAHIEVTDGWLEPLLDPLAKNHNSSTLPVVDGLDPNTLEYKYNPDPTTYMVGGFDWNLIYKWKAIPEWEKKRLNNSCSPIRTPTMLGAFFVIRKDYFELLGMYDPEYEIWGAENLELSFKVWMCGGEMYQIPCSHAAHMFRKKHPYTYPKGGGEVQKNTDRLAEVWLDEYRRFYHRATKFDNRNFGDISVQKKLRQDLGCKSFNWFIENVYQDVTFPEDVKDPPPADEKQENKI